MTTTAPANLDAERGVIGKCLIWPKAAVLALETLAAEMFYSMRHGAIFAAMRGAFERNAEIEIIAVCENLKDKVSNIAQEMAYLGDCARLHGASGEGIESLVEIVVEKHRLRRIIEITDAGRTAALDERSESGEIAQDTHKALLGLADGQSQGLEPAAAAVRKTLEHIDDVMNAKDGALMRTGFRDLDAKIGGISRQDYIVVAGLPSMGKTSLAMCMLQRTVERGGSVAFFTMEMSTISVTMRFMSAVSRVPFWKIRTGRMSDDEFSRINQAGEAISRRNLMIDESSMLTPFELRARCLRAVAERGRLDLVVVDYLQLMETKNDRETRERAVAEISRNMKAIAKEINAPVIALSQLSRAANHRTDKKPQLSDLRDSGAIEQDADIVMFIHRDNYAGTGGSGQDGPADILVRKNRNGETGTVGLYFEGETMRFDDLDITHRWEP